MDPEAAVYFLNRLRKARAVALRDAEAFQEIVFVLEGLGFFTTQGGVKGKLGLGPYKDKIEELANQSWLSTNIPGLHRTWHSPFSELYDSVKVARNDAVHQGAFARHLTYHAIQLVLVLEDAFMSELNIVSDYMVREPVCASLWQPISFVRQQMLANSFSYLPVQLTETQSGDWHLIGDYHVAKYLRSAKSNNERNKRLAKTVNDAIKAELEIEAATCVQATTAVKDVISTFQGKPLLVLDKHNLLVGILTSFDLL